jgi:hypothetical protein
MLQDYENRQYLIFNLSELNVVNFSEVLETSENTLRLNVAGTKTFIKWEGTTPSFVNNMSTKEGPYNHEEIMTILSTSEWIPSQPIH